MVARATTAEASGLRVQRVEFPMIAAMREMYRHEARCQIVHDSALPRGLADPYLILLDGCVAGHAGVWNKYYPGRVVEFYALRTARRSAVAMFRELLLTSGATGIEAQTNMSSMLMMLYDFGMNLAEEKVLFEDDRSTDLTCAGAEFRRASPEDDANGEWVVEVDGAVVGAGGVLGHYNPPYGDVYVGVDEAARRRGVGSFLVQELKRVCYESGMKPAARCDPSNLASRRTLERAGFRVCGRLLAAEVAPLDCL